MRVNARVDAAQSSKKREEVVKNGEKQGGRGSRACLEPGRRERKAAQVLFRILLNSRNGKSGSPIAGT
jgi:hypothetical protein